MKDETTKLSSYLEHLQSQGQYWFLRQDAIDSLRLSDNAFRKSAYRLIMKGKLNRLRGDFYTLVPLEYFATGSLPASWFIDAFMRHLNQKYYVGLLSAAALQGAAHQQPMTFQVITDKLTRNITTGQVRIEFFYKKIIEHHFFKPIKTASGTMKVSTPEMTAFDLVRYMSAAGQVNNVATVLSELISQLNPNTLAEFLKKNEVEITAAQRLGYLIDTLNLVIDLNPLTSELKQKKVNYRLLVPGSDQPIVEHNRRWNILVNESVEPDEL
jgi:predicted transcriptional regulator of viral defense system